MPEVIRSVNLDADQTVFFARELEHVKAKSYDKKYPELKARILFPVSYEAGPGAEAITFYSYDMFGIAKIIGTYANDLPRADVRGQKFTSPVHSVATSYGYTLQDIRAAAMANKPLEQRKANAARRAAEQKLNAVAYNGDATHNLPGLFANPNIPQNAVPNTGSGSSTQWANKTPDQILLDLNNLANNIVATTYDTEHPDTIILPVAQYNYIASTARSQYSDKTILEYFKENNPYIKDVFSLNDLKGAGQGSTDMAVAYRRDPDVVTLEIPQDYEQLPVQEKGLEFLVPCHMRVGGLIIYYPLAFAIAYGI